MQSTTPHEIVIGLVVSFLALAITKTYNYFTGRINAWDNRHALNKLVEMENNPVRYADRMVRRQRMMLGIAGYLICADLVIVHLGWPGMAFLKITIVGAAGICALISGASGKTSTETGVKETSEKMREQLQK